MVTTFDVYIETGLKRAVAGALDWPGWCRVGGDEAAALRALVEYGPRYARAIDAARLSFRPPGDVAALRVVERLPGTATTDFGVPHLAPARDSEPFDAAALRRSQAALRACWGAFDDAIAAAQGRELRKGPRGGGRDLEKIVWHVINADAAYLSRLARKFRPDEGTDLAHELGRIRDEMLAALEAGARGETPERGPRGGATWTPRYFTRRVAWHALDHAWEIEDRAIA